MKAKEFIREEEDVLGRFIQAKMSPSSGDPIADFALKFASAMDDDTGKIAKSVSPVGQDQPARPKTKTIPTKTVKPTAVAQVKPQQAAQAKPVIPTPAGGVSWQSIASYLRSKGLSKAHIAGMLANIEHESGFNPATLVKDSNGLPSGGLFQHNGPRLQQLINTLGASWKSNWKGQLDFALSEPIGQKYASATFQDPVAASHWWTTKWERPKNAGVQAVRRAKSVGKYK